MASDLKSSGKGGYNHPKPRPKKPRARDIKAGEKSVVSQGRPYRGATPPKPKPRKHATPIVTEHTRGQANAIDPHAFLAPTQAHIGPVSHPGKSRGVEWYKRTERGLGSLVAKNLLAQHALSTGQFRGQDVQQASALDFGVAKAIAEGTAHDFTSWNRAPLAALDVLSLAAAPVKAAQVGRAAIAAEEGARAAAAARALTTRATAADILPKDLLGSPEGHRILRHNGLEVQITQRSPSALTEAAQHLYDRLTPLSPALHQRRVARALTQEAAVRGHRLSAPAIPLAHAARKLHSVRGATPKEMAYTVLADYGSHAPEFIQTEIDRRVRSLGKLTGQRRRKQEKRIDLLRAARKHVENPTPELQRAVAEGRALTEGHTTPMALARGAITPETEAARVNLHARLIHGAEHLTPAASVKEKAALRVQIQGVVKREKEIKREIRKTLKAQTPDEERAAVHAKEANVAAASGSGARAKIADAVARAEARVKTAEERLYGAQFRYSAEGKKASAVVKRTRELNDARKELRMARQAHRAARRAAPQTAARQRLTGVNLGKATLGGREQRQRALNNLGRDLNRTRAERARLQNSIRTIDEQKGTVVGAEDVKAGEGAFYTPDIEKKAGTGATVRRAMGLNPRKDRTYVNKGSLFNAGRNMVGPQTSLAAFQREIRYADRQHRVEQGIKGSVDFDAEKFDPEKHALIDTKALARDQYGDAKKVAAAKREAQAEDTQNALDSLSPFKQIQAELQDQIDWAKSWVHKDEDAAALLRENPDGLGLKMIDKRVADAISGQNVAEILRSNQGGRLLDFSNQISRGALIYLNPSYGPVQFTGNLAFLALQQGPWLAANLKRSSMLLSKLSPEQLRRIDLEVGGGAAAALAHEQGRVSPLTKVADFQNRIADQNPRRAAWIYEAGRRGFKTPAEIEALQNSPKLEKTLNEIGDAAQQAMVKFMRNPTLTRKYVGRAIFIFPWIEGSTRWVFRAALDRPLSSRAALEIRDRIAADQEKRLGIAKGASGGFVPLDLGRIADHSLGILPGGEYVQGGMHMVPGINPTAISPYGTGAGVINALRGKGDPGALGAMVQPNLQALGESVTGLDFYRRHSYPESMKYNLPVLGRPLAIFKHDVIGDTSRLQVPLADVAATALRGAPKEQTGVYAREHGPGAAARRALFGSVRSRSMVKENVEKFALEKASSLDRSLTKLKTDRDALEASLRKYKVGITPAGRKAIRQGYERQVAREKARAAAAITKTNKGAKPGQEWQRDALVSDLRLAMRRGWWQGGRAQANHILALAHTAPVKAPASSGVETVTGWLNAINNDVYLAGPIGEIKQALHDTAGHY